MKTKKVGLIGFGCVGQGFYDLVQKNKDLGLEVVKIAVQDRKKERSVDPRLITYNYNDILDDETIDLVVEVISDSQEAFNIVKKALQANKPVVSANKKMIAERLAELKQIEGESKASFLYEAAVCASIPVLEEMYNFFNGDTIHEVSGIVNGSCNYILSKMRNENFTFERALKEAQDLGFAEADPSLDVDGFDAKYKLVILIHSAFGAIAQPEHVINIGVRNITPFDHENARFKHLKIKLMAHAILRNGVLYTLVAPTFVSAQSPHYPVENEYNSVLIEAGLTGQHFRLGKGAGSHPTGLAVLANAQAIFNTPGLIRNPRSRGGKLTDSFLVNAYISFKGEPEGILERFENISERGISFGHHYFKGTIQSTHLSELHELGASLILDENWLSSKNAEYSATEKAELAPTFSTS